MQLEMMAACEFPGCATSSDGTHAPLESCRFGLKQVHKGWKHSTPAHAYNLCVTHTRKILSSTGGHSCGWNDKTLVWFNGLLMNLKEGKVLNAFEFALLSYGKDGSIISQVYRGVWALVDLP